MISVLMPVKNGEGTVGSAVRSTLLSLNQDDELLVLDDGSTDRTIEVLDGVSDPRLRVLRRASSRGVSASLNELLGEARGDLIARMDADDICLRWRFPLELRLINSGSDLVFGGYLRFGTLESLLRQPLPIALSNSASTLALLSENPFAHSTGLFRRDVFQALGGYPEQVGAEDYQLWVNAAAAGFQIRRIGTPVVLYRVCGDQVSASVEWRDAEDQKVLSSPQADLLRKRLAAGQGSENSPVLGRGELSRAERFYLARLVKRRGRKSLR